jgi:hypothetical protein
MTAEVETDWAAKIGASAYSCIVDMVAALECDYDRLEELREERDDYQHLEDNDEPAITPMAKLWAEANPDDSEELAELEAAAGDSESREDAERRIQEGSLSLEVRSDWQSPGEEMKPAEFNLLLGTGGPAVRIIGDLDEHGEPCRARLEVQDWFKPWTQYFQADQDTLLTYCRQFVYVS